MPHWLTKKGEEFDWKGFQKHMGFSDEELKAWKNNPAKNIGIQKMCSEEVQNKWMIVEVIKSHGCANGLQPGDKLYFKGLGNLDPQRSAHWCGHNFMHIPVFQDTAHNLLMQGKDPNDLYPNVFSCVDTTCKYGWGYVENKAYIVDEKDLDKLDKPSRKVKSKKAIR
jgi:hypothetical protein